MLLSRVYSVRHESIHVMSHVFNTGLTHTGNSTRDQIVNDKEFKKDDRVYLDTEASNVDVCFSYSLPGR